MELERPLVSILTPSFNQAQYVTDCVRSIERQDYPELEHVIVDGGSTDGSLQTLRGFESPRCRVIELPGSTQAEALNAALANSRGEVIGWLNTDDAFFGTDAVSTAISRLLSAGDGIAVYGDGVITDAGGRVLRHVSVDARELGRLNVVSPLFQPAVFVRRSALAQRFVREDLKVMIDYELWLYLVRRGRFVKVNRVLAIDRDYPTRKTHTTTGAQADDLARFQREYGVRPVESGSPRRLVSAFGRRLRGVRELVSLEERYSLACRCSLDARWRRAARQLAFPQRLLGQLARPREAA